MSSNRDVTVRLRLDVSGFMRGVHDATESLRAMTAVMRGQSRPPRKPYPRKYSRMTAREYRAARRAYGRAVRAHRRAGR